jgi:elongation factor Ts
MASIEQIKKLRQETGLSISECKKALEEAKGDVEKAKEVLRKLGKTFALKQIKRKAGEGIIASYIHANKKIGVLLDLRCETDFVARSNDFQNLAHELCLQIAAMGGEKLLSQPWIRDETKKIEEIIQEYIAKFGENIIIKRFTRYEL